MNEHISAYQYADDTPLPESYGIDRIILLVRDPAYAYAHWDLSEDTSDSGAFSRRELDIKLRLIDVQNGNVVGQHAVTRKSGYCEFVLPEADRMYVAELVLEHETERRIPLRSNFIAAPPRMPRPGASPVFVSPAEQRQALATGVVLPLRSGTVLPTVLPLGPGIRLGQTLGDIGPGTREYPLYPLVGSERYYRGWAGSEWRFLVFGSESWYFHSGGLSVTTSSLQIRVTIPFLVRRVRARTHLARDAQPRDQNANQSSSSGQGTLTANPDGSYTYTAPDGTTVTMGPATFTSDSPDQAADVAAGASALAAGQAALYGQLATTAGEGTLGTSLATATNVAWGISALFAAIAALAAWVAPATAEAPETPDGSVTSNPDGSVTYSAPDGTNVTFGPVTFGTDTQSEQDNASQDQGDGGQGDGGGGPGPGGQGSSGTGQGATSSGDGSAGDGSAGDGSTGDGSTGDGSGGDGG